MNATPDAPHPLHIVLQDGFRGHTVVIVLDGLEVYRRLDVTTDPGRARADAFDVTAAAAVARVAVSMAPGDVAATMDVDVAMHAHVAISLVGERTVSFEMARAGEGAGAVSPSPPDARTIQTKPGPSHARCRQPVGGGSMSGRGSDRDGPMS